MMCCCFKEFLYFYAIGGDSQLNEADNRSREKPQGVASGKDIQEHLDWKARANTSDNPRDQ